VEGASARSTPGRQVAAENKKTVFSCAKGEVTWVLLVWGGGCGGKPSTPKSSKKENLHSKCASSSRTDMIPPFTNPISEGERKVFFWLTAKKDWDRPLGKKGFFVKGETRPLYRNKKRGTFPNSQGGAHEEEKLPMPNQTFNRLWKGGMNFAGVNGLICWVREEAPFQGGQL